MKEHPGGAHAAGRWWVASILSLAALVMLTAGARQFLGSGSPYGSDNSSHLAEILSISDRIKAGESDFWFDQANLGYPLFLAYHPLPGLFMGTLVAMTDWFVSPVFLFKLSIVLLWAFMPAAWYLGGRWLGMGWKSALLLGLLSIAVNDWRAFGLSLDAAVLKGLYTQSYGMLLLPLATGALYRYLIPGDCRLRRPTLLFALLCLCHVFFGMYLAMLGILLVLVQGKEILSRTRRLAMVFGIALALMAFWLIPFVANLSYQGGLPWKNESENGYPLLKLLQFFFTGKMFDYGRFPWLSPLVLTGLLVGLVRWRDPVTRWMLVAFGVTFLLFLGSTNLGKLYRLIPFHGELEVIRYLSGIHFCGLLLAVLGTSWLAERLLGWLQRSGISRQVLVGSVAVAGIVMGLYLADRYRVTGKTLKTFSFRGREFTALVNHLSEDRRGRFLCHKKTGTGAHFYLNLLPALAGRPQLQSFGRGYHDTLSLYYTATFDFSRPAFRLFNVRSVVARRNNPLPPAGFLKAVELGRKYLVYEVEEDYGYFGFVRTPFSVVGGLKQVRRTLKKLSPPLFEVGVLPRLDRDPPPGSDRLVVLESGLLDYHARGERIASDTRPHRIRARLQESYGNKPIQSRVTGEQVGLNEYRARVEATGREERLLLKVSYHPYWQASVDGRPVPVDHLAPNLMAVDVGPGNHRVVFRYRNPLYQKILFLLSLVAVLSWGLVPQMVRKLARNGV